MSTDWLVIERRQAPLVLSVPHAGIEIPASIEAALVDPWLARKDTDWWLGSLYDFAEALDVTLVRTRLSRTVVDVNRDPDGTPLYPGLGGTELCPTTTFDREPLYADDRAPAPAEVATRRSAYHAPYHAALAAELERLRRAHGHVVLWDAHSIRSRVPALFDGTLPHLNLGTYAGRSCAPALRETLAKLCSASAFTHVVDGRFKGGYITRRYGMPPAHVHAVQFEIALRAYVAEPERIAPDTFPPRYDAALAAPLRALLERLLRACLEFNPAGSAP